MRLQQIFRIITTNSTRGAECMKHTRQVRTARAPSPGRRTWMRMRCVQRTHTTTHAWAHAVHATCTPERALPEVCAAMGALLLACALLAMNALIWELFINQARAPRWRLLGSWIARAWEACSCWDVCTLLNMECTHLESARSSVRASQHALPYCASELHAHWGCVSS